MLSHHAQPEAGIGYWVSGILTYILSALWRRKHQRTRDNAERKDEACVCVKRRKAREEVQLLRCMYGSAVCCTYIDGFDGNEGDRVE